MSAPQLEPSSRYGYFVLQARVIREPGDPQISGILENLSTGEKHPFEGCDALARLLEAWGGRTVTGP